MIFQQLEQHVHVSIYQIIDFKSLIQSASNFKYRGIGLLGYNSPIRLNYLIYFYFTCNKIRKIRSTVCQTWQSRCLWTVVQLKVVFERSVQSVVIMFCFYVLFSLIVQLLLYVYTVFVKGQTTFSFVQWCPTRKQRPLF